jgi:hypothetical protein
MQRFFSALPVNGLTLRFFRQMPGIEGEKQHGRLSPAVAL